MKNQTLQRFVRDECSNFDGYYQVCLDDEPCRVLAGERCGHFEQRVLGPPDYKYKLPGYDYAKLFAQYAEQTETKAQVVEQRHCECGNPLKLRQRFCDNCSQKRRQETQKESQRRFRKKQRVCA
jgi:hypothetical protein